MERIRTYFWRFTVKEAPKAVELLNLCKEIIQKLSAQPVSSSTEDYQINKHQCNFLVGRLTDTQATLQQIQLSPLLDDKTILVLQELHQVLLDVEAIIKGSYLSSSPWPRAAIFEQSEMKETFSRLLHDVQWHTSVLHSILLDNSGESYITFEPAMCSGQLSVGDEFALLTAMKEDEESLKEHLRSVKLDDPTERRLAEKLLEMKLRYEEEQPHTSDQLLEKQEAKEDSTSSPDILCLNPQDLDLTGRKIGNGASAVVREIKLLGKVYAIKIFSTSSTKEFDQEMAALQRLGHHPQIVRLLCYSKENLDSKEDSNSEEDSVSKEDSESKDDSDSKEDSDCYLIMEEMDMDLATAMSTETQQRKKHKLKSTRPFPDVQAVTLMLHISEGMKYIHSKGMAHRDLKSGNILVNFAKSDSSSGSVSRICSVKIADFGLTKTKNATHTYSNQTLNQGTNKWMAPEVIQGEGSSEKHSKFNPRKADVYSFGIICFEILTGKYPYYDTNLSNKLIREQVKAGTRRPNLPKECPPRLATLITRCWHPVSHERPLFPEICRELRYIKGLFLRGDKKVLELRDDLPFRSLKRAQIQGPWGGAGGDHKFSDVGKSISRIKLRYSQSPGLIGLMEVEYVNLVGMKSVRKYCDDYNGHLYKEIEFKLFEFITHITGYTSQIDLQIGGTDKVATFGSVVSLTIHTNITSYGPFGDEKGVPFASDIGRVIGFHGGAGAILDSLGVVIVVGDTS